MVQARPLQPQAAQAHVDGLLGLVAPAHHLEQEAAGVAFLEGVDDFGAGCSERLVARHLASWAVWRETDLCSPGRGAGDAWSPAPLGMWMWC
jgi:hypothetical protein